MIDSKFVESIKGSAASDYFTLNNRIFVRSGPNYREVEPRTVERLKVHSLQAVCDFVNQQGLSDRFVVIDSPMSVSVVSCDVDVPPLRNVWLQSTIELPKADVVAVIADADSFVRTLLCLFVRTEALDLIMSLVSKVTMSTIRTDESDGVSQKVVVQESVALKAEKTVDPIHHLRPYRTFPDIEQPESPYVFRISKTDEGELHFFLQTTSSIVWRLDAVASIKRFLEDGIKVDGVSVIG